MDGSQIMLQSGGKVDATCLDTELKGRFLVK